MYVLLISLILIYVFIFLINTIYTLSYGPECIPPTLLDTSSIQTIDCMMGGHGKLPAYWGDLSLGGLSAINITLW